jgi:superfamily I DNA/RNA helicase
MTARQARDYGPVQLQVFLALGAVAVLPRSRRRVDPGVGTMHRMKSLEFQAVPVMGVEQGTIPAPPAVTPDEDPVTHDQDIQRERCVLFVACTRARDHLYVSFAGEPSVFWTVDRTRPCERYPRWVTM